MRRARSRARAGFSLAEMTVALSLSAVVGTALLAVLQAQERLVRAQAWRLAAAEALRVPAVVLDQELRLLRPAADVHGLASDSLALRAFRGAAVVCGVLDGSALVRYHGIRNPEPTKDSVLLVEADAEHALALRWSRAAQDCGSPAAAQGLAWTLEPVPPVGSLLLLFEAGSYHVAADAFRYRRGAAGRQPLTEALLDDDSSGFAGLDSTGAATADPRRLAAVELRLALSGAAGRAERGRYRIALRNARWTAP